MKMESDPTYRFPRGRVPRENVSAQLEALRLARLYVETARSPFICHALEAMTSPNNVRDRSGNAIDVALASVQLRRHIMQQLAPHRHLFEWANPDEKIPVMYNCTSHSSLGRQTRLAWIDWMIEDLEKQK